MRTKPFSSLPRKFISRVTTRGLADLIVPNDPRLTERRAAGA